MTLDDFIKRLADTPRHWYWMGQKLRITLDGECHCPITAVAALTQGKVFRTSEADRAAGALGLHSASTVIDVADNCCVQHISEERVELRRRLVTACGLTENA